MNYAKYLHNTLTGGKIYSTREVKMYLLIHEKSLFHLLASHSIISVSHLRVVGRVILWPGVGLHQGAGHAFEGAGQLIKLGELPGLGDGAESATDQSDVRLSLANQMPHLAAGLLYEMMVSSMPSVSSLRKALSSVRMSLSTSKV